MGMNIDRIDDLTGIASSHGDGNGHTCCLTESKDQSITLG
jgi:hypothetical protein